MIAHPPFPDPPPAAVALHVKATVDHVPYIAEGWIGNVYVRCYIPGWGNRRHCYIVRKR